MAEARNIQPKDKSNGKGVSWLLQPVGSQHTVIGAIVHASAMTPDVLETINHQMQEMQKKGVVSPHPACANLESCDEYTSKIPCRILSRCMKYLHTMM